MAFEPTQGRYVGAAVLVELARLWKTANEREAGDARVMTQKRLARDSKVSEKTISSWSTGVHLPHNLDQLVAVGKVLAKFAGETPHTAAEWSQLLDTSRSSEKPSEMEGIGRPVGEVDPFALEVHRAVHVDGAENLDELPVYVPRDHDARLAEVVGAAVGGRSAMAVLVSGSSTGKTRSCWEAIQLLPAGWRVWHPYDPTHPEAALAQLPQVGPHTVVWLNESQSYLRTRDDRGERLAAGLRALLNDPARAPVLVLGTLWPERWDTLTRPVDGSNTDDPHAQARLLLTGTDIPVADAFTAADLHVLATKTQQDPRLAQANANTTDGRITQYLAGVPELLARYRNAPPAARALIYAAMDARRLGHNRALPLALLETAVPGYLTDGEWDALPDNWLEIALDYNAAPCKGVRGPLTRIRPHTTPSPGAPHYLLTDYLEQIGRTARREIIPKNIFWEAVVAHGHPDDIKSLVLSARSRGLYLQQARLLIRATLYGDAQAPIELFKMFQSLHPTDQRPVDWIATHATVRDAKSTTRLLELMRKMQAQEQYNILANRASNAPLDNVNNIFSLLYELCYAKAREPYNTLAERLIKLSLANSKFDSASLSIMLLHRDTANHCKLLLGRAIKDSTGDGFGYAMLLCKVIEIGTKDQFDALVKRAINIFPELTYGFPVLLSTLRQFGSHEQFIALAERAAAEFPLHAPADLASLMQVLHENGALKQLDDLTKRAASQIPIDNFVHASFMLSQLNKYGARHSFVLADRLINAPIDNINVYLLSALRTVGMQDKYATLVRRLVKRAVADTAPLDQYGRVLSELYYNGPREHFTTLVERAINSFIHDPRDTSILLASILLRVLREAGMTEDYTIVAEHTVTETPLDELFGIDILLDEMHENGSRHLLATLAARAAKNAPFNDLNTVAHMLKELRKAEMSEYCLIVADRLVAEPLPAYIANGSDLLEEMRNCGAQKQSKVLTERLFAAGEFGSLDSETAKNFAYGREIDGRATDKWSWEDSMYDAT